MRTDRAAQAPAVIYTAAIFISVLVAASATRAGDGETLKITLGNPIKLGPYGYSNNATLGVSDTGVIAAGVGTRHWPGMHNHWITYRISEDGGKTWTDPLQGFGPVRSGVEAWVALRSGGALQIGGWRVSASEDRAGWWETAMTRFSSDMRSYEIVKTKVYMPDAVVLISEPSPLFYSGPGFGTGKAIQLPNGDLLAPMQGKFKGEKARSRVFTTRSVDQGKSWRYHATIAASDGTDPLQDLPGHNIGFAEPSIALLPNGQLLCVMRTQYSHLPGEYRPLAICWSDDLGKTWTKPVPTTPHLMNIHPNLVVLDNGVIACVYGRPGFYAAFSVDYGHTWKDRISFSDLPEPRITGQAHANKIGPNKLMAIGGVAGGGTQVFPVTVERVKVSSSHSTLTGRILDADGNPIAGALVERSPNRYAADDWPENKPGIIPRLAFRSIQTVNGHPTVRSDPQGRFRFERVKLGEYVLTTEARGYAPQQRRIRVTPDPQPQEFRLDAGGLVRGQVHDDSGEPVPGGCVVVNQWHCHTDERGFFHWSVTGPVPSDVKIKIYKRYIDRYVPLEATISIADLASQPIVLKLRN